MHVYVELSGMLSGEGLLKGVLSTEEALSGELAGAETLSGEITGLASAALPSYEGEYEVTPRARRSQTLETAHRVMNENVIVFSVPYYQTSNQYGDTVYIASEV